MASKNRSKRLLLQQYLEQRRPEIVDEAVWHEIQTQLAPISDSYLRRLLLDLGAPLVLSIAGVRQSSLSALEESLLAIGVEYQRAQEEGNAPQAQQWRRMVATALDHARFASQQAHDAQVRQDKLEMVEWMQVWLENPGVFGDWARLRRKALAG